MDPASPSQRELRSKEERNKELGTKEGGMEKSQSKEEGIGE